MPNFEHTLAHNRTAGDQGRYSYNKLMAIFNGPSIDGDNSPLSRAARFNLVIKEQSGFEDSLMGFDSDTYSRAAGCDISALLMPFETTVGPVSGLPGFFSGIPPQPTYPSGQINFHHVLPIQWDVNASGYLYDMVVAPSGDGLSNLVSCSGYYGNTNRYRDKFDIRSIGMRLPMMGVGWGFTLTEHLPFPSGQQAVGDANVYPSGTEFFKGGFTKGWEVDPCDYIAAPIDFRYDLARNVWTCSSLPDGQGLYKVLMLIDDKDPATVAWDYPRFGP